MAEIDENLLRNNGTELEQSISIDRRQEIYEELHPDTKNGAQGGGKKGKGTKRKTENDTMSFSQDTAAKTGKSRSTVERKELIGEKLPISVTKEHVLIAGYHRLKAYESLGLKSIPVCVIDCTALQAELAEIDENLLRNNGTELEQAISLDRRKEIYLELHPETGHGQRNGQTSKDDKMSFLETPSFTSDTAAKTGKSKRTVERKQKIGKKLKGMAKAIKAAGIDDSQKDLTELAELVDKDPEQAQAALDAIAAGTAKTVKAATINQAEMTAASAIKIESLRQLGDMLKATESSRAKGGQPYQSGSTGSILEPVENRNPTLSDMGINKKISSLAQKLSDLPEAEGQTGCTDIRSLDGVPYAGGDCRSGRIRDKTSW